MRPGAWGRGDQNRVVHIQPRADEAGQEGGGRGQERRGRISQKSNLKKDSPLSESDRGGFLLKIQIWYEKLMQNQSIRVNGQNYGNGTTKHVLRLHFDTVLDSKVLGKPWASTRASTRQAMASTSVFLAS